MAATSELQARAACGANRVLLREQGAVWPECSFSSNPHYFVLVDAGAFPMTAAVGALGAWSLQWGQ
jgi:hypothetical protein